MGVDVDQFDGEVEESLVCPQCSSVLESPVTAKCGHVFCAPCLQTAVKRGQDCPKCGGSVGTGSVKDSDPVSEELVGKLCKLSIHCTLGCEAVVPYGDLPSHTDKDCPYRLVPCEHKGCAGRCPLNELESHMEKCDYRLVECKVCRTCLPRKDMSAHQALKRCFEQLNKRRVVTSARRLSRELKDHREVLDHQRHLTDQAERRIVKDHYTRDFSFPRRRTMSAGPVLMRSSVETRVGSAIVVPHYSRNLKSAALESCRGCTDRFLAGRRPSARRHSHLKCEHCEHWRRWGGPRGWASIQTN